jgi:hypothetical protein
MSFPSLEITGLSKYKIIFIVGSNADGKSTLTSEALFYTLFGRSLRYKKISELLSWTYQSGIASSSIGLSIQSINYISDCTIYRTINDDNNKFNITVANDADNIFSGILSTEKSADFTLQLKQILDIDEQKFKLLYLKSPFSEVIFETNSDLLSSITKSNFINDLRADFSSIIKDIRQKQGDITDIITKQNNLIHSIAKELEVSENKITTEDDNRARLVIIVDKIAEIELAYKKIVDDNITHKESHKELNEKIKKLTEHKATLNSFINQAQSKLDHYNNLINRGKCPTCEQIIDKTIYTDDIDEIENNISTGRDKLKKVVGMYAQLSNEFSAVDKKLSDIYSSSREMTNNIIKLNNIKNDIESSLKVSQEKTKSNDIVLDKLKASIVELNDQLTVYGTDLAVFDNIFKLMLNKQSKYINDFYNKKIHDFNIIYRSILSKMTKGKYTSVTIKLDNKPILNNSIIYNALSTSERKFVDVSFVLSYIIYLSTKLKFKTFILDEFFDNFDKENILHIYDIIYEMAVKYNLQIIIASNITDYIFSYIGKNEDVKLINIGKGGIDRTLNVLEEKIEMLK